MNLLCAWQVKAKTELLQPPFFLFQIVFSFLHVHKTDILHFGVNFCLCPQKHLAHMTSIKIGMVQPEVITET